MITIPWVVLLALSVGALLCAYVAWHYQRLGAGRYAQGAKDQADISNRRHQSELELARERAYAAGWNACVEEAENRAAELNGHVTAA